MSESHDSTPQLPNDILQAVFDNAPFGVIIGGIEEDFVACVNPAICRMLGYDEREMLDLKLADFHPPETIPQVHEAMQATREGRETSQWHIPLLHKNGSLIYVNVTVKQIAYHGRPCLMAFFHDVTDQKRIVERLRANERRYRIINDNVADVIWTIEPPPNFAAEMIGQPPDLKRLADAVLNSWRFSFVSPSVERTLGYTVEESMRLTLHDIIATADGQAAARQAVVAELARDASIPADAFRQHTLEIELRARDGKPRWCEVITTYVREPSGMPRQLLGITRDITPRRRAENALRDSEATLRCLFENLPDFVALVDRQSIIRFANRGITGVDLQDMLNKNGMDFLVPDHRQNCFDALTKCFQDRQPQFLEAQDIFNRWWAIRITPLAGEQGVEHVMVIANDFTEQRMAAEAVAKEQRLLRWLLDLHERERQLIAYEIHDGFAQQITGALFQLQGFRGVLQRKPEQAWAMYDATLRLLTRSIDEARRLISGLRPPILDEAGIVEAIEYLVCECNRPEGPVIEFRHDLPGGRLAPPLESALYRIVQESLHNACRHSRGPRVNVTLARRGNLVCVEVRDWGVGFDPGAVEEQRFGLRGIRERVRLLDGSVNIESSPGQGTCVSVELPLVEDAAGQNG